MKKDLDIMTKFELLEQCKKYRYVLAKMFKEKEQLAQEIQRLEKIVKECKK